MMKKNMKLLAVIALLSAGYSYGSAQQPQFNSANGHSSQWNALFGENHSSSRSSSVLTRNNNSRMTNSTNGQGPNNLDLQAEAIVSSLFDELPIRSYTSKNTDLVETDINNKIYQLRPYGDAALLTDVVKKTVYTIGNDPVVQADPSRFNQALDKLVQALKIVLVQPVRAVLGATGGLVGGTIAGGIIGGSIALGGASIAASSPFLGIASAAADNMPSAMRMNDEDSLMLKAAKLIPNILARTLVGVITAASVATIGAIVVGAGVTAGAGIIVAGTVDSAINANLSQEDYDAKVEARNAYIENLKNSASDQYSSIRPNSSTR